MSMKKRICGINRKDAIVLIPVIIMEKPPFELTMILQGVLTVLWWRCILLHHYGCSVMLNKDYYNRIWKSIQLLWLVRLYQTGK